MKISVGALSPGRWSIGPTEEGAQMKQAKEIPGYQGPWPRGVGQHLKGHLRDSGYPVPDRITLFLMSEHHQCPHDWIQAEFPRHLRPGESSAARRAGLEEIGQFLAAA
jgi:hypothetical protein